MGQTSTRPPGEFVLGEGSEVGHDKGEFAQGEIERGRLENKVMRKDGIVAVFMDRPGDLDVVASEVRPYVRPIRPIEIPCLPSFRRVLSVANWQTHTHNAKASFEVGGLIKPFADFCCVTNGPFCTSVIIRQSLSE
jgi:hypothetical protein